MEIKIWDKEKKKYITDGFINQQGKVFQEDYWYSEPYGEMNHYLKENENCVVEIKTKGE